VIADTILDHVSFVWLFNGFVSFHVISAKNFLKLRTNLLCRLLHLILYNTQCHADVNLPATWPMYRSPNYDSMVSIWKGNHLRASKPSPCRTSHPGLLSLAIPPWIGAMSTSERWGVNRHIVWYTIPISVVSVLAGAWLLNGDQRRRTRSHSTSETCSWRCAILIHGRGTVCHQQSPLCQPCIHSVEPWKLIYSLHLSHHLSYIICILS